MGKRVVKPEKAQNQSHLSLYRMSLLRGEILLSPGLPYCVFPKSLSLPLKASQTEKYNHVFEYITYLMEIISYCRQSRLIYQTMSIFGRVAYPEWIDILNTGGGESRFRKMVQFAGVVQAMRQVETNAKSNARY